ncbi:haloalkane dehalogenase [Spectribacter hydrogenoxidans]|uniref:Haloalkane dehalogenase n=1 Tax=Spectribacter hydrogenoxidans TaxID=3075608 RepID=A0ABU3BZH3_9GAMM|nr:haloalkane dehalogenase [Salinisphaera sp. W335]MDT0634707.1 haloalkane dehalogenase [Salinisphaera sp. W335]
MTDASSRPAKQTFEVLGRRMACIEAGTGDPVVFLHGNPTSSYLWRNILPHATSLGRCIVPDLIGMGDSDKLPDPGADSYRFVEHRRYLDALLDALDLGDNVILVLHDWGSGLGFDWANRHRGRVAGICYMEAIVQPLSWPDLPDSMQGIFKAMRSPAGEEMVLDKNVFVERILPASIQRELTAAEMDEYRRPFADAGEARRPTLTWPRQIPIDGEPADVTAIIENYGKWLASSEDLPKLFINADPGIILTGRPREFCRSWPNQEEITVDGLHFIQEDSPAAIGEALAGFIRRVRA